MSTLAVIALALAGLMLIYLFVALFVPERLG